MDAVVSPSHLANASKLRNILATYDQVEDLIRIGMYQQGSSEKIDLAIQLRESILGFLQQKPGEFGDFETTTQTLNAIGAAWPY